MQTVDDTTVQNWFQSSPFAKTAPKRMGGMIGEATETAQRPDAGPESPGQVRDYKPAQATATNWNVDAPQTVQSQVAGITSQDGLLMQQAATQAKQQMNGKGLLNSSMAIGAGQGAVLSAALPIAQQDAQTYGAAAKYNADSANAMSTFNASSTNDAAKTNQATRLAQSQQALDIGSKERMQGVDLAAQSSRQESAQSYDAALKTALQASDQAGQVKLQQLDAAAKLAMQQGQIGSQEAMQKYDAQMKLALQTSDQATRLQLQAMDASVRQSMQQQELAAQSQRQESMQTYDAALKTALQAADANSRMDLQKLGEATKLQLAEVEAKYKQGMQTSQSMSNIYQGLVDNVSRIMLTPDLDAAAKQTAINNITTLYNGAFQSQEAISGLNLGSLLNPGDIPAPQSDGAAGSGGLIGSRGNTAPAREEGMGS